MSFQYINPYAIGNSYQYKPQFQNQIASQYQQQFAVNPYQTSVYNTAGVPSMQPIYMNNNAQYVSLGKIISPNNEAVHLYQLANGQKVAIMPRKDEATIVKTFLHGGSMNETDDIRGISHCIEHCLFKGSSKLQDGDVFKLTSLMGASTNASTDFAQTDYYITAPYMDENNLKKTIEIQGDMVSNPTFGTKEIESEKGPICSEISMINDDPTTIAFDKVIRNLFQINSESENLVAGSIQTVQDLTRNQIVNHHKKFYTPSDLYTVVVGDVNPTQTINLIAQNFTIPPQGNENKAQRKEILTPIEAPVREDIKTSKANYTKVILGFPGPKPQNGKDFIIGSMVDYYLTKFSSSDLKNNLEKISGGYASSMQKVGLQEYDPYAYINILGLNAGEEQQGIDIFYDAVRKLQTTPLTDNELTALKNIIQKEIEIIMCNSESLCDMLGNCFLDNSFDSFVNYRGLLSSINKQDIMNFANKYMDLNKVSMVVVHPDTISDDEIKKNYEKSKYSLQNIKQTNANNHLISFCGSPKMTTAGVKEYKLPNNTHLAINNTNQNLCVFNWTLQTPPVKPKNPAIPAVLGQMFEKGTGLKNKKELEQYKELHGIYSDIYVNGKSIEINADCLPKDAENTLMLLNELLYNPNLNQEDFESAKKYIKDVLKANPKDAVENLISNMYPGYFPSTTDILRSIDSLSLNDIKEFYQELLQNASSAFVATAPFKRMPTLESTVMNYQSNPSIKFKEFVPRLNPVFSPNPRENIVYDTMPLNQAQIYKSYKFPLSGNIEDEAKFEVVNAILGGSPNSRLFSDLREQQNLAYSVSSQIQSFENTGILTLKIQTTTNHKEQNVESHENVEKSIEGFKKHTTALCKELVSDDELEAAKMRLKQKVIGQSQNPLNETSLLAMNIVEPYGIKRIDKYIDAIDKVTKEDVRNASNFIFSFKPTTSIVASEETINSQMPYLKSQGFIQKV